MDNVKKKSNQTKNKTKNGVRSSTNQRVGRGNVKPTQRKKRGAFVRSHGKNHQGSVSVETNGRNDNDDISDPGNAGALAISAKQRGVRARAWCFTINNPTDIDVQQYQLEQPPNDVVFGTKDLSGIAGSASFLVCQLEMGEHGTPHIQGYVYLKGRGKTFEALKSLSPRARFAQAKGTAEQNDTYCSKLDTRLAGPWRLGEIPRQGNRSDLAQAVALVTGAAGLRMVANETPLAYVRYGRGLRGLHELVMSNVPRPKPLMIYLWGPTGTGKTTEVGLSFPDVFYKPIKTSKTSQEWWDGYDNHTTIFWDEFYGSIPWSLMLKLGDDTPLATEVKGGFTYCHAKYVIFASNVPPEECFPNLFKEDPRKFSALVRRLICFRKPAFNKIEFYDLRMKFGKEIVKQFLINHPRQGVAKGIRHATLDLFQYNIFNEAELLELYDGITTFFN